jgi:RHS repeat-associated protein
MKPADDHRTRRPQLVVASSMTWIVLYSLLAIGSANAQIALPGSGVINTIAGNGTAGFNGDNGSALNAELQYPSCVAVDSKWNVYVADYYNSRIRKIAASTGVITTVAGNGTAGYSGDGGAATSAELNYPSCVAVDGADNIYIADTSNNRVRMVAASTGIISTIAGNGTYGYGGDGGTATNAHLALPSGVAVDTCGNIYISDTGNNRIRKVTGSPGTISTAAGNGTAGYSGDNGAATSAELNYPNGISVDSSCNLYIADLSNERIRKVTISTGKISTVAGNGTVGFSGDGGAATGAELGYPSGVAVDSSSNIYIADSNNNRIRKVTASSGNISTIAGNGTQGYSGDGASSTSAEMNGPWDVAIDSSGNIYIADQGNSRIRAVGAGATSAGSAPASPAFSPASGKYLSAQTVTISDTTGGAAIYYTTDGTTPTTSSNQYSSAISVSSTETINAIAVSGSLSSAVSTATYIVGNSPAFSPVPGTYSNAQTISISSSDFGAAIYYTTNGTTPTTSSTLYTGPIGVSSTETIKAIAVLGAATSSVSTAAYTINATSQKSSTATITVGGSEQSGDANNITVSFNGFKETVNYGPFSTPTSIASAFGAKFSNDYVPGGLYAHASGNVITIVWLGTTPFGTLDVEGSTTSFQLTSSGFASQGSTLVDVGTVTLTVGGVVAAQTNYGDGATASSIAEGLAANVSSNSLVNVTAADDTLNIEAKQAGAGTNYSYTLQTTTWDSTDFSQPSFVYPAVSGSLSGGTNASSGGGGQQTVYQYSIPSYVVSQQPTGYDGVGNIVGYTDSVMGGWGLSYDPLYRMTSGSATTGSYAGLQASWGYDPFGNRQSETFSGTTQMPMPTSSTASYNTNNQISGSSLMLGAAVQYDASGDVTQDNQNQYLYDGDGRLCAVKSLYTGAITGYVYGAGGTRVSTGTISTWGSCDPSVNGYQALKDSIAGPTGGQLTETGVDANGNVVWAHTNVWVGSGLLATYDTNGIHFDLNDWNGSRRVQTDYEGNVEQTCANLPYGDGEICTPTPSEFLYAGLQRDPESGLDHAMYRQYSSVFGQWTVPDPYNGSYSWSNPQSLNRYAYVGSNPLAMDDPSGLDGEENCFATDVTITCPLSVGSQVVSELTGSENLDDFLTSIPFVGNFLDNIPVGTLISAGELFDQLFQSFGWIGGGSPFHGNVSASQSGKSVPMASLALLQFEPFEPDVEPKGEGGPEPEGWEGPPETWPLAPLQPGEFVGCPGCFYPDEDGPLPASKRPDFAWYIPVTLEKSDVYYRIWGGSAGLTGNPNAEDPGTYYSFFPPVGSQAWLRQQLSLLPEWGNTMEKLGDEVKVPAGTTVFIGPASAQRGADGTFYSGGGFQVWVPMQ